jgi:hypothetical protein
MIREFRGWNFAPAVKISLPDMAHAFPGLSFRVKPSA